MIKTLRKSSLIILLCCVTLVANAKVQNEFTPAWAIYGEPGHAIWLITAAILVIFMCVPGVILFYGGLTNRNNVLSIVTQGFAILAMTTIMWVILGYSAVFTNGGVLQSVIGGHTMIFLTGLHAGVIYKDTPVVAFVFYQLGFAVITPMLIIGGFAERMKFKAVMFFIFFWEIIVYYPFAHWVWGGGWLEKFGALDYAGGTVVHITSGIAGLISALVVGKRRRVVKRNHYNLIFVALGASILWIGWFGFNGGGARNFHELGIAIINTQLAAAIGIVAKLAIDRVCSGKVNTIEAFNGAIIGLVAITPAAGYVGPVGAIVIAAVASCVCHFAHLLRLHFNYFDDALDTFDLHGVGGIVGALLTGVFIAKSVGGVGLPEGVTIMHQILSQFVAVLMAIVWSGAWTYIILKIIDLNFGVRVTKRTEKQGIDAAAHGLNVSGNNDSY